MLSKDGTYTLYRMEIYDPVEERWRPVNYDLFGYPHEDFKRSQEVFKLCGQSGTFNVDLALLAFDVTQHNILSFFESYEVIVKDSVEDERTKYANIRLVKTVISQQTEIMNTATIDNPKWNEKIDV